MKKLFAVFLMVSVLAVFALPILAAVAPKDPTRADLKLPADPPKTGDELVGVVDTATNWVFAIFTLLAIIFIMLAAFQFVTAGGDAEKVGEARQKLIWASVGILIALASKGLAPVLRNILGAG